MKYIKTLEGHSHTPRRFEVHMTESDLETLDLILTMYTPFVSSRALMLDRTGQSLRYRLKTLRMGVNQAKRAIQEDEERDENAI